MAINEYALPNTGARPRRIAITPDGSVREFAWPCGPRSQPYGIAFLKGAVWYSESNTSPNTLVRFDPATDKFQTWPIPSVGGVVRNMMVTPDGNLVMACSGVNRVGLVEVRY